MIQELAIRNYKSIKKARFSFLNNNNSNGIQFHENVLDSILLIGNTVHRFSLDRNSVLNNPISSISNIINYLKIVGDSHKAAELTHKLFYGNEGVTVIKIVFGDSSLKYNYELRILDAKVKNETLLCNQDIVYQHTSEATDTPKMPEGIARFFKNTININLTNPKQVKLLIEQVIESCVSHEKYLGVISASLLGCGLITQELQIEESENNVYLFSKSVKGLVSLRDANYTIQVMAVVIGLTLIVAKQPALLLVENMEVLDFGKRVFLLSCLKGIIEPYKELQIILADDSSVDRYKKVFEATDTQLNLTSFILNNEQIISTDT